HVLRHVKDNFLEDDVLAPFAAASILAQDALADELVEAVPWFEPVGMDWLVRPLAAKAQIAPVAHRLRPAAARGRIDGVDLLEGELLDGVVLVDEEHHRIQRAEVAIRAAADRHAQRLVSELRFENANVVGPELARNDDEVEALVDELGRSHAARVRPLQREFDIWMAGAA